jgi:hypothetical protein
VIGLIGLILLVIAIGALMGFAIDSPPTRPRPDSRYRGRTFMSVHRRLPSRRRRR